MSFCHFSRERLRKLNSATQYPSIKTYHAVGDRGRLSDEINVDFAGELFEVTEKIDGVNARIIADVVGAAHLVGSRTELLHHLGDVIYNPAEGIVDTLFPPGWQDSIPELLCNSSNYLVVFGEVYGAVTSTPGRKQYTSKGQSGFRIFDIASVPPEVLDWPIERIASWRDAGGQEFADAFERARLCAQLPQWPVVPLLAPSAHDMLHAPAPLPVSISGTYAWLQEMCPFSGVGLDLLAPAVPEGVIVRTADRAKIAKIRYEDYERTLSLGRFVGKGKKK